MKIVRDTRDKAGKHVNVDAYLERRGHELVRRKLDVGDVAIDGDESVCIDLKRNLEELSRNLMNRSDKSRFYKEIRRAHERCIKLYVLCEHGCGIKSIMDVSEWRSAYSGVSGRDLMERIYSAHIGYGVEFLFCDKRSTGRRVAEILNLEEGV